MADGESHKRGHGNRILDLVIVLALIVSNVYSMDVEIESMRKEGLKKHDISIFVEERVEYIHSRVALKPLIVGIDQATKLTSSYGLKVNTSLGKILNTRLKILNKRVDKKVSLLYGDVIGKKHREKRAIEFIGNLISKLFGNPGPEDWKQNSKNILAMKAAIERQIENSAVQHRDIDSNRHAINEHIEVLNHVSKTVFNNVNRLDKLDNALTEWESFIELESMFNSIIEIIDAMEDIKRDAKTSRCNEKGLSSKFLIEHLRDMESNKNGITPIFASWEWQNYYLYEMCTIALYEEELWITIRIPIIAINEEMIRAVPLSNQQWIKEVSNSLGFDTTLFKYKQTDTYMLMLNNNVELCSKFGSVRVCNVRKTKFREHQQYVVPLDINHDRVLITTNSSLANISAQTVCYNNWNKAKQITILGHSVMKVPDHCSIISKSFEVSKLYQKENINVNLALGDIFEVELRQVKGHVLAQSYMNNVTPLPSLSKIVELNNNASREMLNEINVNRWSNDKIWITSSSSISLILITVIAIVIVVYCSKKSKCKKRDVIINLKEPSRDQESWPNEKKRVPTKECEAEQNKLSHESENETDLNSADKLISAEKGTLTDEAARPFARNQFKRL